MPLWIKVLSDAVSDKKMPPSVSKCADQSCTAYFFCFFEVFRFAKMAAKNMLDGKPNDTYSHQPVTTQIVCCKQIGIFFWCTEAAFKPFLIEHSIVGVITILIERSAIEKNVEKVQNVETTAEGTVREHEDNFSNMVKQRLLRRILEILVPKIKLEGVSSSSLFDHKVESNKST